MADHNPKVNGYYKNRKSSNHNQIAHYATKHGLKVVLVAIVVLLLAFLGYHTFVGGSLNPFQSSPAPQTQPAPVHHDHSNQPVQHQNHDSATDFKMAASTIGGVYAGANDLANGYGDRNDLAHFFVDGKSNPSYRIQREWSDYQLGNYRTRSVKVTTDSFSLHGNTIKYRIVKDFVMAKGNHKRWINHGEAQFKRDDGQFLIQKITEH